MATATTRRTIGVRRRAAVLLVGICFGAVSVIAPIISHRDPSWLPVHLCVTNRDIVARFRDGWVTAGPDPANCSRGEVSLRFQFDGVVEWADQKELSIGVRVEPAAFWNFEMDKKRNLRHDVSLQPPPDNSYLIAPLDGGTIGQADEWRICVDKFGSVDEHNRCGSRALVRPVEIDALSFHVDSERARTDRQHALHFSITGCHEQPVEGRRCRDRGLGPRRRGLRGAGI